MKPYKATYPDGTIEYLTKEEAIIVVANARSSIDPKGAQRSRAEARGLLALFDEDLDGLYFQNVTITAAGGFDIVPGTYLVAGLWIILAFVAFALGLYGIAASFAAVATFTLVALLHVRLR